MTRSLSTHASNFRETAGEHPRSWTAHGPEAKVVSVAAGFEPAGLQTNRVQVRRRITLFAAIIGIWKPDSLEDAWTPMHIRGHERCTRVRRGQQCHVEARARIGNFRSDAGKRPTADRTVSVTPRPAPLRPKATRLHGWSASVDCSTATIRLDRQHGQCRTRSAIR